MLKAIRSDRACFNSITFKPGLNIILGATTKISEEESPDKKKKKSLNGVGKSTLIEIINFCLGSEFKIKENKEDDKESEKVLAQKELKGWTFILDILIQDKDYSVHRSTEEPDVILIDGDCSNWLIKPKIDSKTGLNHYKCDEWRKLLGYFLFDLPIASNSDVNFPSFRSLIGYLARNNVRAYISPFENFSPLKVWQRQLYCLYLLGLDWEYPIRIHELDKKKEELNKLQNDLKRIQELGKSALGTDVISKLSDLKLLKQDLAKKAKVFKTNLDTFKIHAQYSEIEDEANKLTTTIHTLTNQNVNNRRIISLYNKGLQSEKIDSDEAMRHMYEQVGIALPGVVLKRLDDVLEFHKKVIKNRASFLQGEIKLKESEIQNNNPVIQQLEIQRSDLLSILQTHGALDEFKKINERYSKIIAQLEDVNKQIQLFTDIKKQKTKLKSDTTHLTQQAFDDYTERDFLIENINSLFQSYWLALYETPASLRIELDTESNQYNLDFIGEKKLSDGYRHMRIFCFDLLIATLWSRKSDKIDFVIHDTIIFSEVFNNQIALALELALSASETNNFQYICCLNSDKVPYEQFSDSFDFNAHVVKTLTNEENGGLLGIRF
jgi:uncharacterized protein YydD (DUF2326 family)